MFRKIKRVAERLFKDDIFNQKSNGDPCSVCGKPMKKRHKVLQVGSGEKMHSKCWSKFFEIEARKIVDELAEQRSE